MGLYANGTTPLLTDTKRVILVRWLTVLQTRSGALAKNNASATDTKRQLEVKIDNSINGR